MKELLFCNGGRFPAIGLGTWLAKPNEVYDAVLAAIQAGYRHIDCASIYGNEAEVGMALQESFKTGMAKREDLFITSKLWNSDHAPERVEVAVRKSLEDLQLDYLDLYLIHWPVAFKTEHKQARDASDLVSLEEVPLISTWHAMEALQKKGLTRHIGVSNFNIPKLKSIMEKGEVKPELNQVELHPYFQQKELVAFCQAHQILVTAYSPLGSRHLVQSDQGLLREKGIVKIAEKHHCTPAQVILAWGMLRGTAVIPKSVHPERIRENLSALRVKLEEEDLTEIGTLERNLRVAKGLFCVLPGGTYTSKSIWEE